MAVEYYLDLAVLRVSRNPGFEDQIQLLSFSWGGHQSPGLRYVWFGRRQGRS